MPSVEYLTYKGVPFPHVAVTEESLHQMENEFQFLNDDVTIVTYPKSGTIWMSEILGLVRQKGDPAWTHHLPMWDRSPWIETNKGLKTVLRSPPPRVLCSHVQFRLFPKSFLQSSAKDLRGSVEKICHFLGEKLNSRQIDSVVEYASFQKMKENKMSNFSLIPDCFMDHKRGTFMRKGICGDWKNHLTVAQSKYFDQVYREKMWGMNTTFPWDRRRLDPHPILHLPNISRGATKKPGPVNEELGVVCG